MLPKCYRSPDCSKSNLRSNSTGFDDLAWSTFDPTNGDLMKRNGIQHIDTILTATKDVMTKPI